jgi:hypothetical protein
MLEKEVMFYIDTTPPQVVTHAAQRDGVRYFSTPQGAMAGITIVDEGVGLSAPELQRLIFVDVFKYLTPESTPLRTTDQGNNINYQRKVLQVTSRPILEYADDYTPDGVDNETWIGVQDGTSDVRHQAWRASYTIHMGQIDDGDTYEVVFYAIKPVPNVVDTYNENAVYLYEDLTKVYLQTWDGSVTAVGVAQVPPDFLKLPLLATVANDTFTNYYQGTFLVDELGNAPNLHYFTRNRS